MMRFAIYCRFSTDKQDERSIERQETAGRAAVSARGGVVVAVFADKAISGASTLNRPDWQRLMSKAQLRAFDGVMVEDLDRAFRDEADYHTARKHLEFFDIALYTPTGEISRIEGSIKALQSAMMLTGLREKVRGGLAQVIRSGRNAAPPAFGYRRVVGEGIPNGTIEIDEKEAETVRRIYALYLKGKTARGIAARLNQEAIAGPRGGIWNASAIAGSRKRDNGILQNALYDGRMVWNRQRFVKDPSTSKRVSRPNPRSQWIEQAVPHLRIVTAETFQKVQALRNQRGGSHANHARPPRHLLSGLLKCGCCGSTYVVRGTDKAGRYMRCSRMVETGLCDNRRLIRIEAIERRVIDGIETHLAAPEIVAEYVREYHRLCREQAGGFERERRALDRKIDQLAAECRNIVDMIAKGRASRTLEERLDQAEAERLAAEQEREALTASPVEFHPNAGELYRKKIADLKRLLGDARPEFREEAYAIVRSLVEKIVIHPTGPRGPVDLEIHGQLATLLKAQPGAVPVVSVGKVVAGVRNNLTHRLPALMFRV